MPPTKRVKSDPGPSDEARPGEVQGLLAITAGVLLLVGLHVPDAGVLLGWLVRLLETGLGRLAVAVPFCCFYVGARALLGRRRMPAAASIGLTLTVLAVAGLLHLQVPPGEEFAPTGRGDGLLNPPEWYGGYVGAALVWLLRRLVGEAGAPIVLGGLALAAAVAAVERTVSDLLRAARQRLRDRLARPAASPEPAKPRTRRRTPAPEPALREPEPVTLTAPLPPAPVADPEPEAPEPVEEALTPEPPRLVMPLVDPNARRDPRQLVLPGMPEPDALTAYEAAWYAEGEPTEYRLPPLELVEPPPSPPVADRSAEIAANSRRLEDTLASFRIEARVVNTEIGPTVTRYELQLAPGIRVSKVANLSDDIALALAAQGIRIEAPVPGKGVIGIEVPNQDREVVHLHPILASREFRAAPGPLPFVVGKDIAGHIRLAELSRMPHVLVAGTTNSGKSVCLNCLIVSLLYRLSPRDLRLLMIDPKQVELSLYDGIPHLDRPVVTDPNDAADLLRGAVREMMARLDRLHELGVRNIASYNLCVEPEERMPYIVIIIDELAELMMLARAEVEASICRIAQVARATGIHLVVATQRPSVNVVTGLIKANIGTRIAFAVAQQVDSRVILDQVGADRLIGRGDMLYAPIDAGKPERIQGAYIDEAQVHKLVEYLQAMPSTLRMEFEESIIQPVPADAEDLVVDEAADGDLDEYFWDCVRFVRAEGEASTSRLQRRFGIGYNRAGRIMDQMFSMGIVGPPRGSKPREVLAGGPLGPPAGLDLDEFVETAGEETS